MKITKLTKYLVLVFALGACSSSDDMSTDEASSDSVDAKGGDDLGMDDGAMVGEVSGKSSSDDFDNMDLGDGGDAKPKSDTTAKADDSMGASDELAAGLDAGSPTDTASATPAPAAGGDSGADAAAEATLSETTGGGGASETAAATSTDEEATPTAQRSTSSEGQSMVNFFDGSQTGANIVGINWQSGYGDNPIKFPCTFHTRTPIKEGEDRFGCVISENSANAVVHVHEAPSEDGKPLLTKVTIDEKGKESEARWEENLKAAGYTYHKDFPWHGGLNAKQYVSGDGETKVFMVWNEPESAATLIFKSTAKGAPKATPVAQNE